MSSIKNNFINEIIDICISEVSKDDTKKKINTYLIEPSFTYIFDRLYPYIIFYSPIWVISYHLSRLIINGIKNLI